MIEMKLLKTLKFGQLVVKRNGDVGVVKSFTVKYIHVQFDMMKEPTPYMYEEAAQQLSVYTGSGEPDMANKPTLAQFFDPADDEDMLEDEVFDEGCELGKEVLRLLDEDMYSTDRPSSAIIPELISVISLLHNRLLRIEKK